MATENFHDGSENQLHINEENISQIEEQIEYYFKW